MNGTIQNQIANDTTSSSPFVTAAEVIYFRGTDNKLYRVNSDGSGKQQIGNTGIKSAPFVTTDGWVWFQGTDDKLYKIFNDGSQFSRPGANDTGSSPVVVGEWIYFQSKGNKLARCLSNGDDTQQIGNNTTKSTPFVTSDGWVYFQGSSDNKLCRVFQDGSHFSTPGNTETLSSPTVVGDWIYFQAKENKLMRIKTDGSGLSQIGNNTTRSTPFVTAEGWVYFQGSADNKLCRVFQDGSHFSTPGNTETLSTPIVGRVQISAGTVGEWVYFQSTGNKLVRLFQPVDPVGTGTLRPKYYILTVLYAPPGTNGGKSASLVDYATGSSIGTTTSITSSFNNGFNVGASLKPAGSSDGLGGQFSASTMTTNQTSENITKTQTYDIKAQGPGEDGIDHDHDAFVLMLNPIIVAGAYPGNNVLWTVGVDGEVMNIQEVYAGWLKNPGTMPTGVKQQLDAAGLTIADYTQILSADPFANGSNTIDPNRFLPISQSFPYEPPYSSSDPVLLNTHSLQNTVSGSETQTVQHQYTVSFSASFSIGIGPLQLGLSDSENMVWTNTNSLGTTTTVTQSATATIGGPAFGYSGPTDVIAYWDTLYNSFMFAFPSEPSAASGTVLDSAGKPVANTAITLSAGARTFKTVTNGRGQYRFYGAPEGNGSLTVSGSNFAIVVGAGGAPPTLRLPQSAGMISAPRISSPTELSPPA